MCNLIINADDFGYSKGINLGIVEAHEKGILTSATLMVTMPGTDHAVDLMKAFPNLGIGLHLNISLGKPLTEGKSLVGEDGNFIKPSKLENPDNYEIEEIYRELEAQYELFLEKCKRKPTHLDSHLFSSDVIPKMRAASIRLAEKYNIPLRNHRINSYKDVKFINHRTYGAKPGLDYVLENIQDIIKNQYAEVMTHPGYVDLYLYKNSSYCIDRIKELEFLTNQYVKEIIEKNKIKLINYSDI